MPSNDPSDYSFHKFSRDCSQSSLLEIPTGNRPKTLYPFFDNSSISALGVLTGIFREFFLEYVLDNLEKSLEEILEESEKGIEKLYKNLLDKCRGDL